MLLVIVTFLVSRYAVLGFLDPNTGSVAVDEKKIEPEEKNQEKLPKSEENPNNNGGSDANTPQASNGGSDSVQINSNNGGNTNIPVKVASVTVSAGLTSRFDVST